MSQVLERESTVVPPEEIARRIEEYRRIGLERHLPAITIYREPDQACPWPDCGLVISGVDFQLDRLGVPGLHAAWWQGPGLVGRCPGCGHLVLYGMKDKTCVEGTEGLSSMLLPDHWAKTARVLPKPPG